jgi:ATP phosphoribosyltransferase regulatory subunit
MIDKPRVRDLAASLTAHFVAAGAVRIEPSVLQPALRLLDLYGEDIRAHAYVTDDPLNGEQLLRPDFTVPVVDMHLAGGSDPARYTYSGEVFRRPERGDDPAGESFQVGFELFDRGDKAKADVEVFTTIAKALPKGCHVVTGDIGILIAAVEGLNCSDRRKSALLRHLWRPKRFKQLLETFGKKTLPPEPDRALTLVGKRTWPEIETRIAALRADAEEPPLDGDEVQLLDDILDLNVPLTDAADRLADLARTYPPLWTAIGTLKARTELLGDGGKDASFEGSYGRTAMEYYDGFVFGFTLEGRTVATGGRYDTLTRILGNGQGIPAVGGIIRPDLLVQP